MGSFRPLGLLLGVLLSLFVCPGTGHRYLGRTRAGKLVFWAFIASFLLAAVALFFLVHGTISQLQSGGGKIDLGQVDLQSPQLREIILDSGGLVLAVLVGFGLLISIYVIAPIELIIREIWRAATGAPIDGVTANP